MATISAALDSSGASSASIQHIKDQLALEGFDCDQDLASGPFRHVNVEAPAFKLNELQKAIIRGAQQGESLASRYPSASSLASPCMPANPRGWATQGVTFDTCGFCL